MCSAVLSTFLHSTVCAGLLQPLLALSPLLLNPTGPDSRTSDFAIVLSSIRILPLQNHGILLLR